jgi:hypothetical protein
MNINEVHLGIEAFRDSVPMMETKVLTTLSLLNFEWWKATNDELINRRFECLQEYFPMVQDGFVQMNSGKKIHIDNTCISFNSLLHFGKLLRVVANRTPYSKHPSYDCLHENDLFDCNIENDPDADMLFVNTMCFILGCVNPMIDVPASHQKQHIMCNVCMAYVILRYMFMNTKFQYSKRIFKNSFFRITISEKLKQLRNYTKKNYLPIEFKQHIEKLVCNMHSIGF